MGVLNTQFDFGKKVDGHNRRNRYYRETSLRCIFNAVGSEIKYKQMRIQNNKDLCTNFVVKLEYLQVISRLSLMNAQAR